MTVVAVLKMFQLSFESEEKLKKSFFATANQSSCHNLTPTSQWKAKTMDKEMMEVGNRPRDWTILTANSALLAPLLYPKALHWPPVLPNQWVDAVMQSAATGSSSRTQRQTKREWDFNCQPFGYWTIALHPLLASRCTCWLNEGSLDRPLVVALTTGENCWGLESGLAAEPLQTGTQGKSR